MAKKKKGKSAPIRPKASPYKSLPITVYFGVDRQPYYIQDALLRKLEGQPYRCPGTSELALEDIDADVGHVLLHFLHTGTYQTLATTSDANVEIDETDIVIDEFQRAVGASEAAITYGLPALQQLSQAEMERLGADIKLHDALRAVGEDSIVKHLSKSTWLQDFVSRKVHLEFKLKPELFTERDFFERISSHTLTTILARGIVGWFSEKVLDLQKSTLPYERPPLFGDRGHTSHWGHWINPYTSQLTYERTASKTGVLAQSVGRIGASCDSSGARDSRIYNGGDQPTPDANVPEIAATSITEGDHSKKTSILPEIKHHADDEPGVEVPGTPSSHALPLSTEPEDTNTMMVSSDASAVKKPDYTGWSDWGFGTPSSKKKKKKKGVECDPGIPLLPTTETESGPERPPEISLAESTSGPAPVLVAFPAKKEEDVGGRDWGASRKIKQKGKELILTLQTTMRSEDNYCSTRLEHLFEGDG